MRLGQVHGAGPFAGRHLGQICLLLFVRSVHVDRGIGAVGQTLVHVERHVGRHEGFLRRSVHQVGKTLTAIFRIAVKRRPAAVAHLVERLLEAGRGAHDAVFQHATFGVADAVERHQHFGGQFARFFDHRACEIAVQLVVTGNVLFRGVQDIMQNELHVFQRCGVASALRSP